jgi:hypothetical protein
MRLRRDELTTCACEPEWPGLETELDGHRMRAEPSPEGSTPMVLMLGLRAYCTRCRARYPFGWTVGDRG